MRHLISPEYVALNKQLHDTNPHYGAHASRDAKVVLKILRQLNCKTILDFGCGKGSLKLALLGLDPTLSVLEYDPAIPGKDVMPSSPVDFLVALDVMEHIEPAYLDDVLNQISGMAESLLLKISLRPAEKFLPDGRNAHLIVEPAAWWKQKLEPIFISKYLHENAEVLLCLLTRKTAA